MARTINVKLILELRHSGMSFNDIARGNHISKHSVCTVSRIAESLGITDDQVANLSNEDLYRRFFPDKKNSQDFYAPVFVAGGNDPVFFGSNLTRGILFYSYDIEI